MKILHENLPSDRIAYERSSTTSFISPLIQQGQPVAALMGGMGRQYDGSYAEYTLVPAEHVIPITNSSKLPWETLAAIPETFLTAWGSLVEAMDVKSGQILLVRGGTSSVGIA